MTSTVSIQVRKEVRALLPAMLGVAAAVAATGMLAYQNSGFPNFRNDLELWVAIVHGLGVLALAALSIGQELTHGTLPGLLVQPISRHRILLLKMLVLIPAVVALGVLAESVFVTRYLSGGRVNVPRQLLVWGPVAAAIGLVPLLTALTRKPLGGVVFAIVIPGTVLVVSERFYPLRDGAHAWWLTWYGTLIISAVGAAGLWKLFPRLEAAGDGSLRPSSRTHAVGDDRPTLARNWVWLLVKKELRLQYLTMSVSGLYVVACVLVIVAQRLDPAYVGPRLDALSELHGLFIPLLAGAFSSAEERQLGTLASQILLPRAARHQWAVKVSVTTGLAVALAVGLPQLLMAVFQPPDAFRVANGQAVLAVWLVTCAAIYVSSLSMNSLWALLGTLPAIGVGYLAGSAVVAFVTRALRQWIPAAWVHPRVYIAEHGEAAWSALAPAFRRARWLERDGLPILLIGVGLLALYFAARNHRSLERNRRVIANQLAGLLVSVWVATVVWFAIIRIARASIYW